MNNTHRKSTFMPRFILALLGIALITTIGARADDAPQTLALSRKPYIQSTTAHSVQVVWDTNVPTRAFLQYKMKSTMESQPDFQNASTLILAQSQTRHHSILHNLQASSVYDYRIGAQGKVLFLGQFQTNKTANQNYQFDVWGDSGSGSDGQKALAAQIDKSKPDFLLHAGDLIYPKGAAEDFNQIGRAHV